MLFSFPHLSTIALVVPSLLFRPFYILPNPPLYPNPRTLKEEEKGKTHIIPHEHTVHELQRPDHDQKAHEHIDQFDALRRSALVAAPQLLEDDLWVVTA